MKLEEMTIKLSKLVKSRKNQKIIYKISKINRVGTYTERSEYENLI